MGPIEKKIDCLIKEQSNNLETLEILFNLKEEGFWGYTIHQKVSSSDLTVSGLVLEEGYMFLNPATPFEPTKYEEQNNNFVTYGL